MSNSKIRVRGYVYNVKLVSNDRTSEESIIDLFKSLNKNKVIQPVNSDRSMIIRTCFESEISGQRALHGMISSAIDLTDSIWLNMESLNPDAYNVPPNMLPNLRENEYLLIPKAHRLFVFLNSGNTPNISISHIEKFLRLALSQVIKEDEQVQVDVHKDHETFMQILESSAVLKLEIFISKTNNDTTDHAKEEVDELLNEINADLFITKIESSNPEGINLDSNFVKGSLEMAEENGMAKGKVIDQDGKTRMVNTEKYPKKFPLLINDADSKFKEVLDFIMKLFRPQTE